MRPIQVLLVALLLATAAFYFRHLRTRLTDRIAVALLTLLGTVMVLVPEVTTVVANRLGVGRGADLIIYLMLLLLSFLWLLFYSRQREMRTAITQIVREQAISQARRPTVTDERSPQTHGPAPAHGPAPTGGAVAGEE